MKKFLFFLLIFFVSLNLASSLQIEANENYSLGESFIAKVSGNFYTPLTKSNVHFYHNNIETSFGFFSLDRINGDYYVSFSVPIEKEPGNYSIRIEDAEYFIGNNLRTDTVSRSFTIFNNLAFVLVNPPLKIPENYSYSLTLRNLLNQQITIFYHVEGYPEAFTSFSPGQIKDISLENYGGNKFQNVFFTYNDETYSSLVYVNLPLRSGEPVSNETETNETIEEEEEENETSQSWWEILFGGGEEENETETNETIEEENETEINNTNNQTPGGVLRTCAQMNLPVCGSEEVCDGTLINGLNTQCCSGTCVLEEETKSSWSTIGWIILGAAVLFLIWFFKTRFSRARMTPRGLFRRY